MSSTPSTATDLAAIERAPPGDMALDRFRAYLHLLARSNLNDKFRAKLDASDVVQQTLLEAYKHRGTFRGRTDAELAGWLRQILAGRIARGVRASNQAKRDLNLERSLEAALEQSSACLERWLAADDPTPGRQAMAAELAVQVAEALAQLPESQREVLVLKHLQGLGLSEICARLEKTPRAVAGLLQRGMKQLRQLMPTTEI